MKPAEVKAVTALLLNVLQSLKARRRVPIQVPRNDRKNFFSTHRGPWEKDLKAFFRAEAALATPENVTAALNYGGMAPSWEDESKKHYNRFFFSELAPQLSELVNTAGKAAWSRLMRSIRKDDAQDMELKADQFNLATRRIQGFVAQESSTLITEIFEDQLKAVRRALSRYIQRGLPVTSIHAEVGRKVGLTSREWEFVDNYELRSIESGSTPTESARLGKQYAEYLKNLRGERIARTEISRAYNFSNRETIDQAVERELIHGASKIWRGMLDDRERDAHFAMEGVEVGLSEDFIGEDGHNYGQYPAEVNERCGVEYAVET